MPHAGRTRAGWSLLAVALLLTAGCASRRADEPIATPAFIGQLQQEETASVLRVVTNDVSTDGRYARLRGSVENTGSERVDGIRYMVFFLSDSEPPRVLDIYQREVDTVVEPGARMGMAIDAESSYNGRTGFNPAAILATPVRLGGKDVPPPKQWK
jgi:hypothetical protein